MSLVTQRGFSMIEVLVSLIVLVIGVIGAASMQLAALRTSHQSAFQAVALQLAAELADKMRANDQAMRAVKNDAPANPFIGIDYVTNKDPEVPDVLCYGVRTTCNASQLAAFDIYEWQRRLKLALPLARVVVCQDSTPWDDDLDNYKWDCDDVATADAAAVIKIGWQAKNPDGSLIKDSAGEFAPGLALAVAPYIK